MEGQTWTTSANFESVPSPYKLESFKKFHTMFLFAGVLPVAGISAILDHIWGSKGVRDKKPPKKGDFVDLNWYVKFSKLLMDETYHNYVSL